MTRQYFPRMTIAVAGLAMSLIALPASAQNRRGGESGGGAPAVARPSSPPPAPSPAPSPAPAQPATDRGGDRGRSNGTANGDAQNNNGSARRRDGNGQVVGTAVPRQSGPGRPGHGGGVIIVPGGYGFYPWGYGGLGFGGYYGGYYDPEFGYGYGGYGLGYGGYDGYGDPGYRAQDSDGGALRIKVTPRDASVYADGYYVGHVDDFDGVLQKLHLSAGPHRLELRDPNYESLTFDVRIDSDQTITYRGEMKKTS